MASPASRLVTFAEFERLPNPLHGRYELRSGEVVLVPPPKNPHYLLQQRLRDLLAPNVPAGFIVGTEFGYCPLGGRDYRIADVAMAPLSGMGGDYFNGAPEVIVEVLSPSNTAREIAEKARISLANGTREFWVLDGKRRQVEVTTKDGRVTVNQSGQEIPLYFAPGKSIAVDAIFG